MHPGGTNIYFVGDPRESMVVIDTGEHYRAWSRRIQEFHGELGSPAIDAILVTHGHSDHVGGVDRLQDYFAGLDGETHPAARSGATPSCGRGWSASSATTPSSLR